MTPTHRAFTAANTDPYQYGPPQPVSYILPIESKDPEPNRPAQPADRWIVKYRPDLGVFTTHPRAPGVWADQTRPAYFFKTLAEAGDYARSRTRPV